MHDACRINHLSQKFKMLEHLHPFHNMPDAGYTESVYQLLAEYRQDDTPQKTDLMVGVFKTDEETVYTPSSVIEARKRLFENPEWHHGYRSSQIGTAGYLQASIDLFFGKDSELVRNGRIAATQALGASGACHMAAIMLKDHYHPNTSAARPMVYIPRESWSNHANVFEHVGLQVDYLPYFDAAICDLNFSLFHSAVDKLPEHSVIVLQTSGQNPTGCDPTREEWLQLAMTCVARGHLVLFDAAYYGMATGCVRQDTEGIRICAEAGVPVMVAATYSKSFGLYSERVGFLSITAPDREIGRRVEMQLRLITRYEAGGFPAFGSSVVELVLSDPHLLLQWENDTRWMASELQNRRKRLRARLEELRIPGDWSYITQQRGMFCLTNLSQQQMNLLRTSHHIYVQDNGRLSISGLNSSNIERVAQSIKAVVQATKSE
ncbi:hypothetical protein ACN42_g4587 [Penicillium freii]|uniref:Aminotransferase class I/classII large domain-containing protein n=1 Tax=Penicillium freii TaxID=48697 RepID=A0A101ML22_PENFR|nr:hypothetical protein ACN42_g4587 [Penicillium freii]